MAMNMADCLARVGFHDKASDYFMASQSLDPKAAPMQNAVQMGKISPIPDCEVLWRALISSSLNDDPLHILAIADQLAMHNHYEATTMAHSFGLSQAERPSLAKEKLRAGSLSHFVLSDKECLTVPPKEYLQGGVVEACINNNFGVVHAREGNPKAATFLFKKSRPILRAGMPYLHLYYNLTLAYLQMGKKNRAISLWEHVRRLGRTDQRKLRDKLQETAQKLELGLDSKTPPRSTWTGTGIGGLLPSYVHLLDCFVLRYRLQEMEEAALKELADESYM
jgi:tetratricopeptide (TPR) repeat protein